MARANSLSRCVAIAVMVALGWIYLPSPTVAATIVVTNTNDTVDGDTSSPAALIANPGTDGTISLREAIRAVNNVPGPNTISFAASLAGRSITPAVAYDQTVRSGVTILGITNANGQPAVTIDMTNMQLNSLGLFGVGASNFTLRLMRIVGMQASTPSDKFGVHVQPDPSAPNNVHIANIVVSDNVFVGDPTGSGLPISIGTDVALGAGSSVSNVTISNNSFTNFGGTSVTVRIPASGANNTVRDIDIFKNTFTGSFVAIELVTGNTMGNRLERARIVGNTFAQGTSGIVMDIPGSAGLPVTTSNIIDDTLISENIFRGNSNSDITLLGGVTDPGPGVQSVNNRINNTRIINNVMTGTGQFGAIGIKGGVEGSSQNAVTGVTIVNNTIANNPSSGTYSAIAVDANLNGGTGNTVSDVRVVNSAFRNNPSDFGGGVQFQVSNSITCQSGYAGMNGNVCADPLFVNSVSGDFHLQPGSPAIGAGTHTSAPFGDLECKARATSPAIGAYESGNLPSCTQIVPLAAVLPSSRSVRVGSPATAFASIINTGMVTANACGLVPSTSLAASFVFQTTDPATNHLIGSSNTPINIAAGATQTFVFGFTPTALISPTDAALEFTCANTLDAPTHIGLDTLLLSASATPVPDLIAIGATPSNDGIVNIPGSSGTGLFATAAINIGAADSITASADDGGTGLPVQLKICQTNPSTGQCINPVTPSLATTVSVGQNQTVTFTVFATGTGTVPFDPGNNRLFLRLKDVGGVTRGSTSVAVRTQ